MARYRHGHNCPEKNAAKQRLPERPAVPSDRPLGRPRGASASAAYSASAARQALLQSLQGGRSTCVTATTRMCARR